MEQYTGIHSACLYRSLVNTQHFVFLLRFYVFMCLFIYLFVPVFLVTIGDSSMALSEDKQRHLVYEMANMEEHGK